MSQNLEIVDKSSGEIIQMPQTTANPLDLPSDQFSAALDRRKQNRASLIAWIKSALADGVDYGRIKTKRGLSRPSLQKPGAEKICGMLGVTPSYPTLNRVRTCSRRRQRAGEYRAEMRIN